MVAIVNPYDFSTLVDLTESINIIESEYGFLTNSGLYQESGTVLDAVMYNVETASKSSMVGFTSRRERNTVKDTRYKKQMQHLAIPYIKHSAQIAREDLAGRAVNWATAREETIAEVFTEKLQSLRLNLDQSHEYLAWTAAQGQMRNPEDQSINLDMFEKNGVARPTLTWNVNDPDFDLIGAINALRNQLATLNKLTGSIGLIDIPVGAGAFNKIVTHPQLAQLYVSAYQGRGREAIANPVPWSDVNITQYGVTSTFEFNGVRFIVYPQNFFDEEGDAITPVANNKGFTICRGVRGLYKAAFAPDNNLDSLGQVGQKFYAWRTPLIDRHHFEIIAETAPVYYMTRPELSIDITFIIA